MRTCLDRDGDGGRENGNENGHACSGVIYLGRGSENGHDHDAIVLESDLYFLMFFSAACKIPLGQKRGQC